MSIVFDRSNIHMHIIPQFNSLLKHALFCDIIHAAKPHEPKGVWIVNHPMNVQTELDQLVNLSCEVSGDLPIAYRWTRDGVVLPGELLPYFLVQEVKPKHRGAYACVAMNEVNSTTSQPGLLTINGI